jgi:hypothetical protein
MEILDPERVTEAVRRLLSYLRGVADGDAALAIADLRRRWNNKCRRSDGIRGQPGRIGYLIPEVLSRIKSTLRNAACPLDRKLKAEFMTTENRHWNADRRSRIWDSCFYGMNHLLLALGVMTASIIPD